MFATGPPDGGAATPLAISRAQCRVYPENSPLAADPGLRRYLADLVGPHRLALREDLLEQGAGHSYGDMAEPLIEALVPPDAPVDLLVIAYGVHDVRLGRATATYLSGRCPGGPLAFAVCDQGVAAAFSALRLINAHTATGDCRRALLLVAEQAAVPYELAGPAPVPDRHAAVGLLLEPSGPWQQVALRTHTAVPADKVATLLAEEVAGLAAGRSDVTLVAGAGLPVDQSTVGSVGTVRRADAGTPYTGIWSALCEAQVRRPGRLVLLADHDPTLGYLCVAALACT